MSYAGTLLVFTKKQPNEFSITKHASESAERYSQSSMLGFPEEELIVTTSDSNITWMYTGVPDTRVSETKESLLIELQCMLSKMGDDTKALLLSLNVGEEASQLISGTCFTESNRLKLRANSSNPPHYSFFASDDETCVEGDESAASQSLS